MSRGKPYWASQRSAEELIRQGYDYCTQPGEFLSKPVEATRTLGNLVALLSERPEILEGKRLQHNLSRETLEWAKALMRNTQPGEDQ
jgi:hypothetical protein